MGRLQDLWALLGRMMLAAIYVESGYGKIMHYAGTGAAMTEAGLPAVEILLPFTIFVELGGALALIFGYKTRLGAFGLLIFTLLAALFFHKFWVGDPSGMQMINFMKNIGMSGGMLMVMAFGPGRYSVDKR